MNKESYINTLRRSLQSLSQSEVNDIVSDVEEHFVFGLAEGKTEQQIADTLGSPIDMAAQYLGEIPPKPHTNSNSSLLVLRIVLALFIGPFLLSGYAALLSFFIAGIAMIIASFTIIGGSFLVIQAIPLANPFFMTLSLILMGVGTMWLSTFGFKYLTKLTKHLFTTDFGGSTHV